MVFDKAYIQQGVCSPSRNSFLSGRRPDTTQICAHLTHPKPGLAAPVPPHAADPPLWRPGNFKNSFRTTLGDCVSSWPGAFKNAGYITTGMGKVYHPGHPKLDDGNLSCAQQLLVCSSLIDTSTSAACRTPVVCRVPKSSHGRLAGSLSWAEYYHPNNFTGQISDEPDNTFQDGKITDTAIERLQRLGASKGTPFFMAVGLHKPHLPVSAFGTAPARALAVADCCVYAARSG